MAFAGAHKHIAELKTMSVVLDACPRATELVLADLIRRGETNVSEQKGCEGMTAEQVLRAMIVKQMDSVTKICRSSCATRMRIATSVA